MKLDRPVVILAGGLGTRLAAETEFRPKPLVRIGRYPILWHIMKIFSHHGFKNFIICLGYKGEMIREFFYHYQLNTGDVLFDAQTKSFTPIRAHDDEKPIDERALGELLFRTARVTQVLRDEHLTEPFPLQRTRIPIGVGERSVCDHGDTLFRHAQIAQRHFASDTLSEIVEPLRRLSRTEGRCDRHLRSMGMNMRVRMEISIRSAALLYLHVRRADKIDVARAAARIAALRKLHASFVQQRRQRRIVAAN